MTLNIETVSNGGMFWDVPFVVGTISDTTRDGYSYTVQVDLDPVAGNFQIDASVNLGGDATTFAYRLSSWTRAGTIAVNVLEWTSGTATVSSGYVTHSFDVPMPANGAPIIREVTNNSLTLADYTPLFPIGSYRLDYDSNSDGVIDQTKNVSVGTTNQSFWGGGRVKVTEVIGPWGEKVELGSTGWVAVSAGPAEGNAPPVFSQQSYTDTVFYGDLKPPDDGNPSTPPPALPTIDPVSATDADDDDVKYSVGQGMPGWLGNGFYAALPSPGVTIDEDSGALTISNVDPILKSFRESGSYSFTVYARDGSHLMGESPITSVTYTIYDNGSRWLDEAMDLIEDWSDDYRFATLVTANAAHAAIQEFDEFVGGFGHITAAAGLSGVLWTAAFSKAPVTAAALTAITTITADALASNSSHDDVLSAISQNVSIVTVATEDEIDDLEEDWEDEVAILRSNLYPNPPDDPNNAPYDVKAQEAYDLYVEIAEALNYDNRGYVDGFQPADIVAPTKNDILGNLIVQFVAASGGEYSISWSADRACNNNGDGWYTTANELPSIFTFNSHDIVSKLNAIDFQLSDLAGP